MRFILGLLNANLCLQTFLLDKCWLNIKFAVYIRQKNQGIFYIETATLQCVLYIKWNARFCMLKGRFPRGGIVGTKKSKEKVWWPYKKYTTSFSQSPRSHRGCKSKEQYLGVSSDNKSSIGIGKNYNEMTVHHWNMYFLPQAYNSY